MSTVEKQFTVFVDGKERHVTISSNVLCPRVIRGLLVRARKTCEDQLKFLKSEKIDMPPDLYSQEYNTLWQWQKKILDGNPEAINPILVQLDSLAFILHTTSPEVSDFKDAEKIIDSMESIEDLLMIINDTNAEVEEAAKNSPAPAKARKK